MIKYVIFDMDGTLFDSEPCFEKSWSETGEELGLEGIREMYYPQIAGKSIEIVKSYLKDCYGEDFDSEKFFADRWDKFCTLVSNGVEEKPYCFELLKFLKDNGIKTALATSTPNNFASIYLYKSKIPNFLDAIVFGNEVKRGKPYPDIFIEAGKRISSNSEETIVVGDSSFDMLGGHAAGMRTVMVIDRNPPSEEAERVCYKVYKNLSKVKELIKSENNL